MIKFLVRCFISDRENVTNTMVRIKYGMLCGVVGIGFNIFLFLTKLIAGWAGNSMAVMADAFNNLSDACSSVVSLLGFKFAAKESDDEHPFGHGRYEYIAGLIVSILILIMGVELCKESIIKTIHFERPSYTNITLVILILSIFIKIYMAYYNRKIGEKIKSMSMLATAKDSMFDVISTTVVFLTSVSCRLFDINLDGICGIVVSAFIMWGGVQSIMETTDPLLGLRPDKETVENIYEIVFRHKEVVGVHDVMIHDYGPGNKIISLHVELPGSMDVYTLHDIVEAIEEDVDRELKCKSVIHMDPIQTDSDFIMNLREELNLKVLNINEKLSVHDLRILNQTIYFDLVFPGMEEEEMLDIMEEVEKYILEKHKDYGIKIKPEKEYC